MSFDRLAAHYRWMEVVLAGEKLQRCRTAFLPQVATARNVLILGEGNGRFLVECRRRLRHANLTCVDASKQMLQLSRERLRKSGGAGEVQFVHSDALQCEPPRRAFDLVVTHFFLDCFRPEQLKLLVAKLAGACLPNAAWLLADFCLPEKGWRRHRASLIHWLMYRFFRLATGLPARVLTPPDPFLLAHNFVLKERVLSDWDLLHSDFWFLKVPAQSTEG